MDQHAPKPPPASLSEAEVERITKNEADRLTIAFMHDNAGYLRGISLMNSPRTEGYIRAKTGSDRKDASKRAREPDAFDDLARDVGREFYKECMKDPDFRAKMLQNGIGNIQQHPYFHKWKTDALAAQHAFAFRLRPRQTCQIDELFLRIAAIRPDGRLYPFVRQERTKRETSYMKVLLKSRKLEEVDAWQGDAVWDHGPSGRPRTLRLTEGREGAGQETLERLKKAGFIVEVPCQAEQALVWRRDEYQRPWTLVVTDAGRHYLSQVDHLGLSDPVDEGGADDEDGPAQGVQVASAEGDAEDQLDAKRFQELVPRLSARLAAISADPALTGTKRRAFLKVYAFYLRVPLVPMKDRPKTFEEVAARLGVALSTVHRWEENGRDEDHLAALLKIVNDLEKTNHLRGGLRPHNPIE